MITENLSTLKIHKLTQAQYDRELAAGNIDPNALYLTPNEEADLSNYATKSELPTKTSDLTNDSGFLTGYTETDPTVPAWAKASTKPSYTADEIIVDIGSWETDEPTEDDGKAEIILNDLLQEINTESSYAYTIATSAIELINQINAYKINGHSLNGGIDLKASDVGALPAETKIPSKTSDLTNDSGYLTSYTESDPTVPAWAKASTKPTYTKNEIGLGNVDNTSDANKPVSTEQAIAIADAKKAGTDAQSNLTTHINNKSNPHNVTASQVGADASGTAESLVAAHNEATDAHADIRAEIAKVDAKIVNEIAIMSQSRYSDMTQSDLANLYVQGVRMIAIADIVYTNLVPLSVDENGNVYNGTGYKDNARLSSSGGVSGTAQDGSVVTGFIPFKAADIIRIKGAEWVGATQNHGGHYYLHLFNASKSSIGYIASETHWNNPNAVSAVYDETTGVTTIDVNTGSNFANDVVANAAYFRLNAYGKGADLIVTVNEEI